MTGERCVCRSRCKELYLCKSRHATCGLENTNIMLC